MRKASIGAVAVGLLLFAGPAPVAALFGAPSPVPVPIAPAAVPIYVYVPNVLVIQSASDADAVLTALEISMGVQPSSDPVDASRPDLNRLDREARIMEKHWRELDAACDPNAVFARMYLTTTYGVRYHIQERYFADNDYLSIITVSFAKMYLDAYADWKAGRFDEVPTPWLEAFEWAKSGQSSLIEDEFLGMNAHINYDLTNAIAALGTSNAAGESRKPDMDRINHVLADVYDDVQYDIARYYGPTPPTTPPNRGEGHDPSVEALEAPVFGWREHAWTNAVLLESMPDDASRAAFDDEMQAYSGAIATGLQQPDPTTSAAARVAYCQAHS